MILVRFPVDPIDVPNGTHDCPDNIEDIVLQGHRRSLADWLAITRKTLEEHRRLVATGLSVRQALVHGLPYCSVPTVRDTELLFASVPPFTPDVLSDLEVRVNRMLAHMHLYAPSLPEDLRAAWARRLLTQCYACWRRRKVWHPCHEDWYPHAKVLGLSSEERRDVDAWKHLVPVYLDGNWVEGFYPTARLEKFFVPRITKQVDRHTWHDRMLALKLQTDVVVSVEAMARALGVHKYTLYRSWAGVGVDLAGKEKTYAKWLSLAKKADAGIAFKNAKRKMTRKGNMRG